MAAEQTAMNLVALNSRHLFLSQFWRLKAQNEGVGRTMLSLQTPEKNRSLPLPASGVAGNTRLVAASLPSLPGLRLAPFLVWICVSPPLLKGTRVIGFGAQANAVQPHLNSLLMSLKTPVPNRYNLRLQLGLNFGATLCKPLQHCTFLWFFSGEIRC